ncbi:MAG TPA: hypothetical protein DCX07_05270 [Phycisphaerales bacterium]|nr:hypothetical protein [Phycisphaerales bacterium]
MNTPLSRLWIVAALASAWLSPCLLAEEAAAPKALLDVSADGAEKLVSPQNGSEDQIRVTRSQDSAAPGLIVTIQPGKADYPGIVIKPPAGAASWDLSAYGHVEARIVNTGTKAIGVNLRVDNAGDWRKNPWNCEQAWLKPGNARTVSVIFGYSFGRKPGFALKPEAVTSILLFTGKANAEQAFRIEWLRAAGPAGEKPPVDPNSIRIRPANGVILDAGVKIDAAAQIVAQNGAEGSLVQTAAGAPALRIEFPAAKKGKPWAALKPPVGRWDLRDFTEVRVKVKNVGTTPATPTVLVSSGKGNTTDLAATDAPLSPGSGQEIVVSFIPTVSWKGAPVSKPGHHGGMKDTGTTFANDAVDTVRFAVKESGPATLQVESITACAPAAILPDWVGKRPPVPGEWVKTFDDEFDGPAIDETKWCIYGPNYWDKRSHWTKDNLVLGGGMVRMRYEKKTGFHNDDPSQKQTDYACGFLETYGKWVQRYGYFEARMKLPKSPGLWPAFWLMPDRGVAAGPQWKRQDTAKGGMEFDIMEHLTRWGPNRYNLAAHWDGYDKGHKAIGSTYVYVPPDKDGFITSGLLWLPGLAVWYGNGKEVARWEDPRISNVQSDLMFTLVTGGWDNNSIDDAQLPADLVIDYVRVWQRKDLASSVDGPQPAAPPATQPATESTEK